MGEPVVVTRDLTKKYGELTALDQLSIEVEKGKILGFIGPNGAGKTTTIKILVGLARPTSGSASIAGADCVRDAHRIKRLVGYMFYVARADERGAQLGGPLTVWHYHVWSRARCFVRDVLPVGLAGPAGGCERGDVRFRSPEMLHVWLVDHPKGPFATSMNLDPILLGQLLRKRDAERPESRIP